MTAWIRTFGIVLSQVSKSRPFDFAQGKLWGTQI